MAGKLQTLIEELTQDPSKVNDLTPEQVTELRRQYNPYGAVNRNEDARGYVCLSVTNLQEKYMERMDMVTLASFLYKIREEYNIDTGYMYNSKRSDMFGKYIPKDEITTEYRYMLLPDDNASLINRADDAVKEYSSNKMDVFRMFADLNNTGEKLRKDLFNSVKDYERCIKENEIEMKRIQENGLEKSDMKILESQKDQFVNISNETSNVLNKFNEHRAFMESQLEKYIRGEVRRFIDHHFSYNPKVHLQLDRDPIRNDKYRQAAADSLNKSDNKSKDIKRSDKGKSNKGKINKSNMIDSSSLSSSLSSVSTPSQSSSTSTQSTSTQSSLSTQSALEPPLNSSTALPSDIFESFRLYKQANYDEIVKEVEALWALKPELENIITIFEDGFETEEDALKYKEKNKDTFTVQVHIIRKGHPHFLSSFSANREKLEYYNKNTEILKAIEDRIKEDEKVGEKLLKNRVKRVKKTNTEHEGPDHEGAYAYFKENVSPTDKNDSVIEQIKETDVLEIPIFKNTRKGMTKTDVLVEAGVEEPSTDTNETDNSSREPRVIAASSSSHAQARLEMAQL